MFSIKSLFFSIVGVFFFSLLLFPAPPAPTYASIFTSSPACTGIGVIGCRAFDSISSMLEINDVGVPNSPNRPLTNSKCRWNGGSDNCYPVFDTGNCSLLDSLGPRSHDNFESAKRWSPCYDSNVNAARLTFWNDLGSSVQRLNAIVADPQEALSQIWTQYEIMLSPEFFFSPEGTTSSKLYRIERVKTTACRDERFTDHRFLTIYPDEVTIGPVLYCAGISYAGSEAKVTLDNARANNWIRITTHYDLTNSTVNFWAYDVTTNQLLSEQSITTHQGVRLNFPDATTNIKGLNFTQHSSSHAPNPDKPSPNYWLKNAILSKEPISPYSGSTPTNPTDTTAPTTTASPSGDTYTTAQTVSLSPNETATTYYTTNGSTPSTSSSVYSNTITISTDTTLKFYSIDASGNTESIKTETYVINTSTPVTCTSWTYSSWGTCQSNSTQTRTVTSSLPSGCSGGTPIITQSCTYTDPSSDTTAPTITTDPTTTTTDSATISFTTDEISVSYIDYGFTTDYDIRSSTNTGTTHSFTLLELSDGSTYNYRITATDVENNQTQSDNYTFTTQTLIVSDTTEPEQTSNLSASNVTRSSVDLLSWIAPGDDNDVGTASVYDIRYYTILLNNLNWELATQATNEPVPSIAGTTETYTLVGLTPGTTYYIGLRTSDEASNTSPLSNIATLTTLPALCVDEDWIYSDDTCRANGKLTRTWTKTGSICEEGINKPETEKITCSYQSTTSAGGSGGSGGGGGGSIFVDTIAPKQVTKVTLTPVDSQITIKWTNPTDNDYVRTIIVRKQSSASTSRIDGEVIYEGTAKEYTDTDLDNGQTYYYAIYTHDNRPNYSNPVILFSVPKEEASATETATSVRTTQTNKTNSQLSIKSLLEGSFYIGLKNDRVRFLQEYLAKDKDVYPEGITSGYFGPLTQKAVQRFQIKYNIVSFGTPKTTSFGNIGPKTFEKLEELYGIGIEESETVVAQPTAVQTVEQTIPTKDVLVGPFSVGADNSRVKLLQEYLAKDKAIYPEGIISGYYGKLTKTAVQRFQIKYNIVLSGTPSTTGFGLAGPVTRIKIQEVFGNIITQAVQRKSNLTTVQIDSIINLLEVFEVEQDVIDIVRGVL